jgi:hypothetical protein
VATNDDLKKQLASIETHAKAVLSWVAEARKTIAALDAAPSAHGFNGGL